MDYEKAYKEALERAKAGKSIGEVFPELKESEDERIRREIIEFLELPHPQFVGKRDHEEWIAWLEKQKEPHYTKRNQLFDECVAKCDPEVMKEVSDNVDRMLEQKPAEWSEQDEKNIEKLDGFLTEVFCYGHVYVSQKDKEELQTWLKSLHPQPHWKPSEEQMEALGYAIEGKFDAIKPTSYLSRRLEELEAGLKTLL